MPVRALLAAVLALCASGLCAEETPPGKCGDASHRAFDFWLGDWEVFVGEQKVGDNTITASLDGCALAEHWRSARGGEGRSLNAFDASSKRWQQFWVDAQGATLTLIGGPLPNGGGMRLSGRTSGGPYGAAMHRITWTPLPDGHVRQLWESLPDDAEAWHVLFDGNYRRPGATQKADPEFPDEPVG